MTTFLREKVSKKKRRFKQDGFDLDLAYITERIVALGFPSSDAEALYRNPLPEVYRFFEHYHAGGYKLYNLCAERRYDITKFHSRVSQYPFYDHNAPPVKLIQECCQDVDAWLSADDNNAVGINCKAGKGRTGLIICCYLLHSGVVKDTDEALKYYGERRTKDGKGVTIASQQRYIRYYERVIKEMNHVIPRAPRLTLEKLIITSPPKVKGGQYVLIERDNVIIFKSLSVTVDSSATTYEIPVGGPVKSDCKISIALDKSGKKPDRICHFWFNTGFVQNMKMVIPKKNVDVANKDKTCKRFRDDFILEAVFGPYTGSDISETESDEEKPVDTSKGKSKEKKRSERNKSTGSKGKSSSKKGDQSAEEDVSGDESTTDEEEDVKKDSTPILTVSSTKTEDTKGGKSNKQSSETRERRGSFYDYDEYEVPGQGESDEAEMDERKSGDNVSDKKDKEKKSKKKVQETKNVDENDSDKDTKVDDNARNDAGSEKTENTDGASESTKELAKNESKPRVRKSHSSSHKSKPKLKKEQTK